MSIQDQPGKVYRGITKVHKYTVEYNVNVIVYLNKMSTGDVLRTCKNFQLKNDHRKIYPMKQKF